MRKLGTLAALAALLILTVGAIPAHAEPCEPGWVSGVFGLLSVEGNFNDVVSWDDGSGGALYAGGSFVLDGSVGSIANIARWNGSSWSALAGSNGTGVNGAVHALAVFDDGSGPALYVGGGFTTAGGVAVNGIARWDGTGWSAVAGADGLDLSEDVFPTTSPVVYALTVYDDGTGPALYAGGRFSTAGGVTVNCIARWDGSAWSALTSGGTGVDSGFIAIIDALTVYDDGTGPVLYAGGFFTTAGEVMVSNIARWDGSAWSGLEGPGGVGVNSTVSALTVFDDGAGPALYAGGNFTTAGGVTVNRIARWNGSAWSPLIGSSGVGVSDRVHALAVFDVGSGPALYAGGDFTSAGGLQVSGIARWHSNAWSRLFGPIGNGLRYGSVYALTVFDDGSGLALYAGGDFTWAGGVTVNRIARWNGYVWSALEGPGGVGVNNTVVALTVFDDGTGPALYAGGPFTTAGGMTVNRVARWDGSEWSRLFGPGSVGVDNTVYALTVFDDGSGGGPALYAGGQFTTAGGVTVNNIARWDGNAWSALEGPGGVGVDSIVWALTVFDDGSGGGPALYAGGQFTTAGGVTVNRIARWDGSDWSALEGPGGVGVNNTVIALTAFDDGSGPALYAGGLFTTAGGVSVNRIARWDGSDWTALEGPGGVGVNDRVYALTVYDDSAGPALYAGGQFIWAGGLRVNRIARWDGSDWSPLIGSSDVGVSDRVRALTVLDDGSGGGPALYAGGNFTIAGGVTVNHIARWDGSDWSSLEDPGGVGMNSWVYALTEFDDGTGPAQYAGGAFTTAGGWESRRIAKWTACTPDPSCNAADLAEPFGLLDLADIVAFVTAFGAQDPAADLAEPFGVFDLADVVAFIVAFEAGCS